MLSQDFKEFIQALNANEVRYLVVGGYALAAHGFPRYTKDLDILLDSEEANAERVVRALSDFGFASLGLQKSDFMAKDQVIQLGYPPNRIDLLTSADGINFAEIYPNRITIRVEEVGIDFIDIESLKVNKRATGRPQDLADLDALEL